MTEDEAKTWLCERYPSRFAAVSDIVDRVLEETQYQNLIAATSVKRIWSRHVVDSAQLLTLDTDGAGLWVDIGTGGGFPGLVVMALSDRPIVMVEPRRKRAEFLASIVRAAAADSRASVVHGKVEALDVVAATVSARAVASIEGIFAMSAKIARPQTRFLLHRGRNGHDELAAAQRTWRGVFHVEQSLTDPDSVIVVAEKVARR